jgi:hypothetical protein
MFKPNADWMSVNPNDPDNDNYSILDQLDDSYRVEGKFAFRLRWPQTEGSKDQIWKQTSNPVTKKSRGVDGYEPVSIAYTGSGWGGLEYNTGSSSVLDGNVDHSNWHYAVGSAKMYYCGIPGFAGCVTQVELWVRDKATDALWDKGDHGSAIALDGASQYWSVPAVNLAPQVHDMTGCAWAKFESTSSGGKRQYLIDIRGDGGETNGQTYCLIVDEVENGQYVKVDSYFGSQEVYSDKFPIVLNSWNHYCTVRRNAVHEIYIDGLRIKSGGSSSNLAALGPNRFRVGSYSAGHLGNNGQYFSHGSLCEVRLYNRALSSSELRELFLRGPCWNGDN